MSQIHITVEITFLPVPHLQEWTGMGRITGMDLNLCPWVFFMYFIWTDGLRGASESDKAEEICSLDTAKMGSVRRMATGSDITALVNVCYSANVLYSLFYCYSTSFLLYPYPNDDIYYFLLK